MNNLFLSSALTLAAVAPFASRGQDVPDNLNRISFGPTFGLNFKADFFNNSANPGPATGGANHNYNDGYVRLDGSGNAGGVTGNWGYQNASQYNAASDAMQFHALAAGGGSSTDNPQYGGELLYQRVLGRISGVPANWGIEGAFGFTKLDLSERFNGSAPVIVDSYALNGVVPPGPGYNGTAQGPGALLGDTPTRTATSATLTGSQRLSGESFSLRAGPFVEWYFTSQWSVAASAGLTLAPTTLDYDFSETAILAGGGQLVANGHSSSTSLLYGPYAGAMLRYDFSQCWGLFIGARFQSLTDMSQSVGNRTARLDPGATLFGTIGVSWRF